MGAGSFHKVSEGYRSAPSPPFLWERGIGDFFIGSYEFTARLAAQFGAGRTVDDLSDAQYIKLIYGNLLGRAANAEELAFWRELADICRSVRC